MCTQLWTGEDEASYRVTGFYSHPQTAKRNETWDLLKALKARSFLPCLCLGNFNEIINIDEKRGGKDRPTRQIEFRNMINDCELKEILVYGPMILIFSGS
ncbi:hypothetical protein DITRI_Ditri09bG0044700 [Diplodiscus trichospermus]